MIPLPLAKFVQTLIQQHQSDPGTDNDWKNERLDLFIATKLANYDILLLQEVWTPMNEGRKEKLMQAAQEQGFPYYVRSACLGKLTDAMLLILSRQRFFTFRGAQL